MQRELDNAHNRERYCLARKAAAPSPAMAEEWGKLATYWHNRALEHAGEYTAADKLAELNQARPYPSARP